MNNLKESLTIVNLNQYFLFHNNIIFYLNCLLKLFLNIMYIKKVMNSFSNTSQIKNLLHNFLTV